MTHLAIETSTLSQSLALGRPGELRALLQLGRTRGHARLLAESLQQTLERSALTPQDLQGIVVGLGPGSFTGLRIGLAFASGLARATDLPLIGAPSWLAAAAALPPGGTLLYACDARKGEVYAGVATTGRGCRPLIDVAAFTPEVLRDHIVATLGTSPGLWRGGNAFRLLERPMACIASLCDPDGRVHEDPPADGLLELLWANHPALCRRLPLEPLYIRPSEAELSRVNAPLS